MTNKMIKGEVMSATTGGAFRGRLSLMAGSSLVAATIVASTVGVMLTPTAALAANECVPVGVAPTANGTAPDTYDCPTATIYSTGVTYSSAGALTVATSGGLAVNMGTVGINLTGNTSDSVTLNTTTSTVTGTSGPVIDVTSVSGPIDVTVAAITGTGTAVTFGVLAQSTGGGDITITNTTGNINVTANPATAQQQAAIRAITTGGNGAITISTRGTVTGRQSAIRAQTSGAGALTINAGGALNVNASAGQAAIDAITGTGLLTINVTDEVPSATVNGQNGSAIRAIVGGDIVINIAEPRTVSGSNTTPGTLNLTMAGTAAINNLGDLRAGSGNFPGGVVLRAAGAEVLLNNDGTVWGVVDVSAVTGEVTLNNNSVWLTRGTSVFGAGETTFNNAGLMVVGGDAASSNTMTNLDAFMNGGELRLGDDRTDVGDLFSMPGTAFEATGSSVLIVDANLGATGQAGCTAITVADCFYLPGGSTSGVTTVAVTALTAENVITDGIVLVDVAGGETHAGDFVLDIASTNYGTDAVYGGVITTPGMLAYALQYDEATQTHRLVSVVPTNRFEYTAGVQEVLSAWHTTAGVIADRQSDLRRGAREGFWVRGALEHTNRDVAIPFSILAGDMTYEDAYTLNTTTGLVGYDLLAGSGGNGDFVLGVHGGYVRSELERDASPTVDTLDGVAAGLYAGWWVGGLTLDATLNTNLLKLTHDRPASEVSDTNVISVGGRAEAGWMLPMGGGVYVQPLLTVAFVRASVKEVIQETFAVSYDDVQSMRAAVGVRAGGAAGPVGFWVLGRAWNEFADDGAVTIGTEVEDVRFVEDFSGAFQEVGAGLTLANASDTLEGFASAGAKFRDDIDNYTLSLGVRMRW